MLDWLLSIKNNTNIQSSTDDLFNDLMQQTYNQKAATGGISAFNSLLNAQGTVERIASQLNDNRISGDSVDTQI